MIAKIAGSILIVLSSTMIGMQKGQEYSRRYGELAVLRKIFLRVQSEIRYSRATLEEVFQSVSRQVPPLYCSWLGDMSKMMRKKNAGSFSQIWRNSVNTYISKGALVRSEIERLSEIGDQLGSMDAHMQLRTIEYYLEHLDREMKDTRDELKNKVKLCRVFGLMGGVLLVVLLS